MQFFILSLIFLFALLRLSRASFYDNPPLELPVEGGAPVEELERKWGTDVSSLVHSYICDPSRSGYRHGQGTATRRSCEND